MSDHGSAGGHKRRRKSRTAFTNRQIDALEQRFLVQKYLTPLDRDDIARTLGLSNAQVITWFQNRRAKLKRDAEELKADMTAAIIVDSTGAPPPSPSPPFRPPIRPSSGASAPSESSTLHLSLLESYPPVAPAAMLENIDELFSASRIKGGQVAPLANEIVASRTNEALALANKTAMLQVRITVDDALSSNRTKKSNVLEGWEGGRLEEDLRRGGRERVRFNSFSSCCSGSSEQDGGSDLGETSDRNIPSVQY